MLKANLATEENPYHEIDTKVIKANLVTKENSYHKIKTMSIMLPNLQEARECYQQFATPSWLDRHIVERLQESFGCWRDFDPAELHYKNEMEKRRARRVSSNKRMLQMRVK